MFNNVQKAGSTAPVEVEKTSGEHFDKLTKELQKILTKSLKKDRWEGIDLGAAANYSHDTMVNRWVKEKNKWLNVSR